ncbi:MAG: HvfC/BufC family peptide modification chaperone, partial [Deefgea sp.]
MSQYHDILSDFAHALDDKAHPIECLSEKSKQNIGIYRNNIQLNRINALRIAFPTINTLVGEEFFDAMSLIYVRKNSATHANLHAEGDDFFEFIANFSPAAIFPYLSDVARLDWAIHSAHYAEDTNSVDANLLAAQADRFETLRFEFHPAMHLIESPYPNAAIWAMHHSGDAPKDLNEAECVLVWRDQHTKISALELRFITALQAKHRLADALEIMADYNPHFDPANALSVLL